jgi:hypothetical protein
VTLDLGFSNASVATTYDTGTKETINVSFLSILPLFTPPIHPCVSFIRRISYWFERRWFVVFAFISVWSAPFAIRTSDLFVRWFQVTDVKSPSFSDVFFQVVKARVANVVEDIGFVELERIGPIDLVRLDALVAIVMNFFAIQTLVSNFR